MGKVQFYDRLPFILIFSTAFLPSGMASTKDDPVHNEGVSFQAYDENYSMKIKFANNYETFADLLWNKMKNEENAVMLSDDQFFDGKALINLPFGIQLFDLNVTRVAVTKEGTILSADPSANWTIAPLNAKSGMSRCNISYLIKDKNLYVRWNNFRFSHMYYFKQYEFSFQVRLGDRGDIDFVYRRVPYNLLNFRIHCDCLGDKFGVMYSCQEEFKVPPFKETYELGYSMDLEKCKVKDGTVARFSPADKCMFQKNCYDCTKTQFHINASENCPMLVVPSNREVFQHEGQFAARLEGEHVQYFSIQ
ncbi:Hypothetical predicted protein [Cloeon dipterum]|uniref:Uncharacterized protein n=1 Tax=Cloeon dipterum TaxID=197152 RepID=A0A8S1DZR2_9INSE|nr:Hypothetical predicted protein [Cloeon dipterum]